MIKIIKNFLFSILPKNKFFNLVKNNGKVWCNFINNFKNEYKK